MASFITIGKDLSSMTKLWILISSNFGCNLWLCLYDLATDLLVFCVCSLLHLVLFCDCSVDQSPAFLQFQDSLVQVSLMKMSSCVGAHVLLLFFTVISTAKDLHQLVAIYGKWHLKVQGVNALIITSSCSFMSTVPIWQSHRTVQTLHAVNANKVGHASVHLLTVEQLKR